MAVQLTPRWGSEFDVMMIAGEAIANPYVFLKLGTNEQEVLICADTEAADFVAQTAQATVGGRIRCRPMIGESYVRANADLAKGDYLKPAASDGEADTVSSGYASGKALEAAAAAGTLFVAQLFRIKL